MKNKKGVFFSIDALIALGIIFLIIIVAFPIVTELRKKSDLHYDILTTLSSIKIGEMQSNPYVAGLIAQGIILDLDKTVLEQIGELYVINQQLAKNLATNVLADIKTNENVGLWFEDTLIWSSNSNHYNETTAKNIDVARQIISGLGGVGNSSVTGFSARAYLTSKVQNKYFYFGGYVGDGNLSAQISYNGIIQPSAKIEITINENFSLYVNNIFVGVYNKSPDEFTPANYTIPTGNFISGTNTIKFVGDHLHVAGGFVKITYETNVSYVQPARYYFPGIEGLINLYDGFYVPGNLNGLNILLHMNSSVYRAFLNIGNKTVYNHTTNDEQTITVDTSSLNLNELSLKTIPIRLGLENISSVNASNPADVFAVSDLSQSMKDCQGASNPTCPNAFCCSNNNQCSTQDSCQFCGCTWTGKLSELKNASKSFIDGVLNYSTNRVGLVSYGSLVYANYSHILYNNATVLKNNVSRWLAPGPATCICCGIDNATYRMSLESDSSKFRSMVV